MDEIELLSGVLTKTTTVVAGVSEDQWRLPTPCDEFSVHELMNHLVG